MQTTVSLKKKVKENSALYRRGGAEIVVFAIAFIIFIAYAVSLLAPFYYLIINSFQSKNAYFTNLGEGGNAFQLPKVWHPENFLIALQGMSLMDSVGREIYLPEMIFNSVWYTIFSAGGGVIISAFSGYALAKYDFIGKNTIYAVIIFTLTVPIVGSSGAAFKLMSDINIYNSPLFLITALCGYGTNFLVLYGFFKNLSWSFAEAVFIDGGGHFTAFFKVMLPQTQSAMLTLFIMAAIGSWNDYSTPLLYMPDFPTLASGLYRIQTSFTRNGNVPAFFAGLIISVIPVVVVFSCCSGTIMENFTVGGLKG